jgi:hypothetical protein
MITTPICDDSLSLLESSGDRIGSKYATTITVDEQLLTEFRAAIILRYGHTYGNMYDEWNAAIKDRTVKLQAELRKNPNIRKRRRAKDRQED